MNKKPIDVSIIIINYNTAELTIDCVTSIYKNTHDINFEVILIDNASADAGKLLHLKKKHKNLSFIENKINKGFSRANNQGIGKAKGNYVLFLNSDTKLDSNVVADSVKWLDAHPKAGIVSCQLLNKDSSVQGTGGYFPILPKVFTWMLMVDDIPLISRYIPSFHPANAARYQLPVQLDWLTGAFLLVRSGVISQIKGFDEDYFMYVEDVDFCFRAKRLGWEIWLLPNLSIIHYGGSSSESSYPLISEFKNLQLFYKKHFPLWELQVLKGLFRMGTLLRIIVLGILRGSKWATLYAKTYSQIG